MKKKNEKLTPFEIVGIIFIIFSLTIIIRMAVVSFPEDGFCKYHYGEDYVYDFNRDFGSHCVRLFYNNLTKADGKSFLTSKERREICQVPGFFELNNWNGGVCNND